MPRPSANADQGAAPAAKVAITLNAVLAAVEEERPKTLCVDNEGVGLPYGPFDPARHRTFEIGVREWVERQTRLGLGYIEQLYTFGDKGREAPAAALAGAAPSDRLISVGYLALARQAAPVDVPGAGWRDWYHFFPWEDWRGGEPAVLAARIVPELTAWTARGADRAAREARKARADLAFGLDGALWEEARTLERYELMYEIGIVEEAWRDRSAARLDPPKAARPVDGELGGTMISDHRRILATAVGRLRGKLRYRPVVFEMTPPEFTLLELQRLVEAIVGFEFHKQNFRRSVEQSALIERTGAAARQSAGRPAALFRVSRDDVRANAATGLALPRLRR